MTTVGIRALKQNASAVVAEVAAGRSVTITDRGRPVAQMSPIAPRTLQRLADACIVRLPSRALQDLPPPVDGPSLTRELVVMRDAERW